MNRRRFLGGILATGAASVTGCQRPSSTDSERELPSPAAGQLPPRQEFLVRSGHILTMDSALGELPEGDIHVRDGQIVSVGRGLDVPGIDEIDAQGMIALPGLVDTHWHMWGSSLRSLVGDGEMDYFRVVARLGRNFTPQDNYRGVRLALAEAVYSGITTVHNWSHNLLSSAHVDSELRAHQEMGVRGRFSYGYSRLLQGHPDRMTDFVDLERIQRQWFSPPEDPLLSLGFASRGPQNTEREVHRREWEMARSLGLPITQHASRSREEAARIRVIDVLHRDGLLGPDVLLVHTYQATSAEHQMMADTGVRVSISPFTASRMASGFPQLGELLRAGVQVGLSVDTTTVSGSADMFGIMRLALNLHHLHRLDVLEVQPRKVLELATIDGARTLGLQDQVGSLVPGKRADLILVRATDLNMAPLSSAVNLIVQSAQPGNVDTVVVDGRILKRKGTLVAVDVEEVVRQAAESLASLRGRASRAVN